MTCAVQLELIVDYLDGKLSLWQRTKFWLHLPLFPSAGRLHGLVPEGRHTGEEGVRSTRSAGR